MFHSEHGQDRWLASGIFAERRDGIFVEFGALDGAFHSNSLFFERERGWRGLLIEANPRQYAALRNNRPLARTLCAAVSDHNGTEIFRAIRGGLSGWSGISSSMEPEHRQRIAERIAQEQIENLMVPCITLDEALSSFDIRRIDYLSIDVEGAEWDILRVFPFSAYEIDVIGIEDNFGRFPLDDLLAENGYAKVARLGIDNIYRKGAGA